MDEVALRPTLRKEIKKKLADSGVKLVNFGVCGLLEGPPSRKTFEFAKDMGIETIVSEPAEDAFDALDKLCEEYEINIAIHDHPKPSHYWNPDTVLKVCKGRSKRIGACADTGHWMRSGLNPIECLKKLEGRIISFHFKDLNKMGRTAARRAVGHRHVRRQGDAGRDPPPEAQGRLLDRVRVQLGQLAAGDRRVGGVLRQGGGRVGRR